MARLEEELGELLANPEFPATMYWDSIGLRGSSGGSQLILLLEYAKWKGQVDKIVARLEELTGVRPDPQFVEYDLKTGTGRKRVHRP